MGKMNIDLSWSPIFPNLLLSASMDHYVCLWDVSFDENKCLIKEYDHGDIVTSVSFNPIFGEIFITGCFEHFVHVWKFERYEGIEVDNDNNAGIILLSFEGDNINKSGKKKLKENKDTYNSFIDKTIAPLETQNNNNVDNCLFNSDSDFFTFSLINSDSFTFVLFLLVYIN